MRRYLIAIIGSASAPVDGDDYRHARECGRLVVDAGHRVLTGGLDGVMEAASRGAHESAAYREGDTVGLLPGHDPAEANQWIDIAIPTGLGHLRNGLVAASDAVIAIGGGAGTLSEICFAWMHRRPVVSLAAGDGWASRVAGEALDQRHAAMSDALRVVIACSTCSQAADVAIKAASERRRRGGIR